MIAQCQPPRQNESFANTSRKLWKNILNFSRCALFHMKTRFSLTYLGSHCSSPGQIECCSTVGLHIFRDFAEKKNMVEVNMSKFKWINHFCKLFESWGRMILHFCSFFIPWKFNNQIIRSSHKSFFRLIFEKWKCEG